MKRTPMEMSCWRIAQRGNRRGTDFRVFRSDMLWKRDGLGSGMRKARKSLLADIRAANVLARRAARKPTPPTGGG